MCIGLFASIENAWALLPTCRLVGTNASVHSHCDHFTSFDGLQSAPRLDVVPRGVFGFPAFYGKNMDAWIDCMTSLDKPEEGMSTVHCASGSILTLELNNANDFAKRCPEQYEALVHCAEFVNTRRIEVGETAVLALDLKS